ncbi:programmed cell death protein 5 [Chironomus tepperi]|uniref:programmed cell death protein 5 n=1 Tax=Chironomus tepperi TaxID=113505 RepID=UPI00391F2903
MANFGPKMPGGMSQMQNQMDPESQKKIEEQKEEQVQMKNMMLASLLDQEARARLNNLKLSKPDKADAVENIIIQMAQRGQIGGKLDDKTFTQLLESLNQQMTRSTSGIKVNYDRRRNNLDSDSDEDY